MHRRRFLRNAAALVVAGGAGAQDNSWKARLRAVVTLPAPPDGAGKLRVWLMLPRDDGGQRTGAATLNGPGAGASATGGTNDNFFAYWEVDNPRGALEFAAEVDVRRGEFVKIDDVDAVSRSAEPINARSTRFYAADLRAHPGLPVGGRYAALATEILKGEANPVLAARRLYDSVLETLQPEPSPGAVAGDAPRALQAKRGGPADYASLFASLGRSANLPVRLVYGHRLARGAGGTLEVAGPACWAEFFALGVGWLPADPYAGDTAVDKPGRAFPFGGLDSLRLSLAVGRELILSPKQAGPPVSAHVSGYAEVDGAPLAGVRVAYTFASL